MAGRRREVQRSPRTQDTLTLAERILAEKTEKQMEASVEATQVVEVVESVSRKDRALAFLGRMDAALDTGAQKAAKVTYPAGWVVGKLALLPVVGVVAQLSIYGAEEYVKGARAAQTPKPVVTRVEDAGKSDVELATEVC